MASEKTKGKEKGVNWKRNEDGILDCDDYNGQEKAKCLALKVKEQTVKDTKKAMGMKDKPKQKAKVEPKPEQDEE
jgi:hypothetical protein